MFDAVLSITPASKNTLIGASSALLEPSVGAPSVEGCPHCTGSHSWGKKPFKLFHISMALGCSYAYRSGYGPPLGRRALLIPCRPPLKILAYSIDRVGTAFANNNASDSFSEKFILFRPNFVRPWTATTCNLLGTSSYGDVVAVL